MRAEAEAAYEELDAETAAKIKVPKLAKADSAAKGLQSKLDEQEILLNHRDVEIRGLEEKFARIKEENDALSDIVDNFEERLAVLGEIPENLRDENITSSLAKEPDIDEANRTLGAYVRTVVNRMLPPTMAIDGTVWVSAARVGRDHRIMPGDWLRFVPGKGESPRLCQCVGEKEYLHRRVVREWVDGRWEKEHIVNGRDESCYRVISEPAARALVAEAFPKEAL
jgi:hypothetical protein